MGFPRSRRQDYSIWVVVDIFTKSAHFIPMKSTNSAEDHEIYIDEIVILLGIPLSIISDRGTQLTS